MIEVFGRATSSIVQAVMWAIGELGLEHIRHDIGHTYGGNDTDEYRAMNPMGLVPVIRDGDVTMFESAAIIRYLGATYGAGAFWPEDPAIRGPLDMWAEWIKTAVYPVMVPDIFFQLVRNDPATLDQERLNRSSATMAKLMGMLDARLGAGPWLAGETFTYADVMVGHLLYRYHALDFPKVETPNIAAYYAQLTERPAFAEHAMVSFEPLRWKG